MCSASQLAAAAAAAAAAGKESAGRVGGWRGGEGGGDDAAQRRRDRSLAVESTVVESSHIAVLCRRLPNALEFTGPPTAFTHLYFCKQHSPTIAKPEWWWCSTTAPVCLKQ